MAPFKVLKLYCHISNQVAELTPVYLGIIWKLHVDLFSLFLILIGGRESGIPDTNNTVWIKKTN